MVDWKLIHLLWRRGPILFARGTTRPIQPILSATGKRKMFAGMVRTFVSSSVIKSPKSVQQGWRVLLRGWNLQVHW